MGHAAPGLLASLHATPAFFRTDAAVFVFLGMPFALVPAQTASRGASVEHAPDHFLVGAGPSCRESARDIADVSAIEVEPDALGQFLDFVLGKTGIGTRRANLRA